MDRITVLFAGLLAPVIAASAVGVPGRLSDETQVVGISAEAAQALQVVAAVLAGTSTLTCSRTAEGGIQKLYKAVGPKMCFPPTKDPRLLEKQRVLREQERLQFKERYAKRERWMQLLRRVGDGDQSGVLTVDEARILRRAVEMGMAASQLGIVSLSELAEATRRTPAAVAVDISTYCRLESEAAGQGLEGLPMLPDDLRVARP